MDYKMWRIFRVIVVFIIVNNVIGCANKATIIDGYVKDAIRITFSSSLDLNFYNQQSHPLIVVIYELAEPNAFKELASKKETVGQLLSGENFDKSVMSRLTISMQPGYKKVIQLDRAEGARYLGVVAGFYQINEIEQFSRLYSIDLFEEKPHYWSQVTMKKLTVDLILGRNGFSSGKIEFKNTQI